MKNAAARSGCVLFRIGLLMPCNFYKFIPLRRCKNDKSGLLGFVDGFGR
jgi:hypothetical protein